VHPILGSIRRLAIYLLAWLLIGLLLSVGLGVRNGNWLTAVAFFVPLGVVFALISQSAWYVCRIFPLVRSRAWPVVAAQILAAVFASAIWVAAAGAWARTLEVVGLESAGVALYQNQRALLFVIGALLFWLVAIFFYLLIAFDASKDAERANVELSLLAREAELKALRAQIDPHFIFNSLHSISSLTATDPAAARRMCLLLADFLRETLRLGSSQQIPLSEELALADRFLAIEQVRLGQRLVVSRETGPGSGNLPGSAAAAATPGRERRQSRRGAADRRRHDQDGCGAYRLDVDHHARESVRPLIASERGVSASGFSCCASA
jgi:hypothetical protein